MRFQLKPDLKSGAILKLVSITGLAALSSLPNSVKQHIAARMFQGQAASSEMSREVKHPSLASSACSTTSSVFSSWIESTLLKRQI